MATEDQATPDQPTPPGPVPLVWVGLEDASVVASNQFLGQFSGRDEFVITFGEVTPPPLLGTPEERLEQARQISYVPVRVLARVGLNRHRFEELMEVLKTTLANYDEAEERGTFPP
jgi:hypothetical protein